MTMNFNLPAVTDNYTSAYNPNILAAFAALGQMLDPAVAGTVSNQPTGTKRLNAGLFEQWSGSTWAAYGMGYLLKGGDTMTGTSPLVMQNTQALSMKNTTASNGRVVVVNASNDVYLGDIDGVFSGTSYIRSSTQTNFQVAGTVQLYVSASAVGANRTLAVTAGAGESVRLINDAAYVSFFNTANTTRTGYLQGSTGSSLSLFAENGANLNLGSNSIARLTLDTTGNLGFRVTPSAWSTLTAFEGSSGALAFNGTATTYYVQNLAFVGGVWTYKSTAAASSIVQSGGSVSFNTVVSGTAGATATLNTQMTLDNSGNLTLTNGTLTFSTTTAYLGHGSTTGSLTVGANGSLSDNTARIELYDTVHATLPKRMRYCADVHTWHKSAIANELMRMTTAGLLGIGVAAPLAMVHTVGGDIYAYNGTNTGGQGGAVGFGITPGAANTPMATIKGVLSGLTGSETQGGLAFSTRPSGSAGQALTERMRIDPSGNVLVNKASTLYSSAGRGVLEIDGTSAVMALTIGGAAGGYLYHDGTNMYVLNGISAGYLLLSTNSITRISIAGTGQSTFTGGAFTTPVGPTNSGTAITLDARTSNVFRYTMNGNVTSLSLSNMSEGQTINIWLTQDGTGSRTLVMSGIKWPGGAAPALSTAAGSVDIMCVSFVGGNYYGTLSKAHA